MEFWKTVCFEELITLGMRGWRAGGLDGWVKTGLCYTLDIFFMFPCFVDAEMLLFS